MKLLFGILFLAALVGLIAGLVAFLKRRGSGEIGYRRRFESRYRHGSSPDTGASDPVFMPVLFMSGSGDPGAHHHAQGHSIDCGAHAHVDGGATGCGDGGSN